MGLVDDEWRRKFLSLVTGNPFQTDRFCEKLHPDHSTHHESHMQQSTRPFIIDIEASGFGPHSYPIEVGLALELGTKFCSLITPAKDWTHWDAAAEKVRRVPRDILETHGKPATQVALSLNALLGYSTVYSDGWVVDKPWLIELFSQTGVSQQFAISPLEMILSEHQMGIWRDVKEQVTSELALTRHRASFDALIIQETYLRTRNVSLPP